MQGHRKIVGNVPPHVANGGLALFECYGYDAPVPRRSSSSFNEAMLEKVDAIVVGAGIIGIAIARELALAGRDVMLVDGEPIQGSWTSSRNSEVIHAGLHYPIGSLKARLCVEGRDRLYEYCARHAVPHKRLGKLIFARDKDQIPILEEIMARGNAAGVEDLRIVDTDGARRLEPQLGCAAALFSPSTGIVDSHALMIALMGEAAANVAMFVPRVRVTRAVRREGAWHIHVKGEDEAVLCTSTLVNSAGLGAQDLASAIEGLRPDFVPPLYLARGIYFTLSGRAPFEHLIYPVPEPGGLGLHLTLDLAGQARFGPDVQWIDSIDYHLDATRKPAFITAAKAIWPDVDPDRLEPGYTGIRPKISGPGEPAADFVISLPSDHGCEGLVNLFGIESPGLTSALAIARYVREGLA